MTKWLETGSSVAIILVCGVITWSVITGRHEAAPAAVRDRIEAPLPTEPVSLERAETQGSVTAPLAMVIYSDFECPFCQRFAREVLPELRGRYVASGQLLLAYRHLPSATIHPNAMALAKAATCAGRQGRFVEMHDGLFRRPKDAEVTAFIEKEVSSIDLDFVAFERCVAEGADAAVMADVTAARRLDIRWTPAFLLGELVAGKSVKVQRRIAGARPLEVFSESIDSLLGMNKNATR